MNSRTKTVASLMTVLALTAASAAHAGTDVVAHPGVADASLDARTVQKVFLGKQSQWSDGTSIKLGVLADGPVADEFLKSRVRKSPSQFSTFWKKAVFSGTGTAPKEFGSSAELVAWVAATPGAVGFVESGAAVDGVKILEIH